MSLNSQVSANLLKPNKSSSISNLQNKKTPLKSDNRVKSVLNTKKPNCNPDLIKACEIIMKKVQNNDMKQMAKEFLREKGYLK